MNRPRVLLADDHRLIREALVRVLEPACDVVGEVEDGLALMTAAEELQPDIVLLEVALSVLDGFSAARRLVRQASSAKIVFLTAREEPSLAAEAFRIGASGYLLKHCSAAELLMAMKEVANGQSYASPMVTRGLVGALLRKSPLSVKPVELSSRQKEVLRLLVEGLTMKAIARALDISPRTVAFHKYGMMQTLGLGTSAELIQYACRRLDRTVADRAGPAVAGFSGSARERPPRRSRPVPSPS